MNKLIYKNENGGTLEFGSRPPFLITTIDGLGAVNNEIYTSKSPNQDGVSVNNKSLSERHLTLEGVIITRTREERQRSRRRLLQTFNSKLNGELTIYQDGEVRKINCIPELAPSFPSAKQENYQPFMINLYCPNPYWLDNFEMSEEIMTWIGGITFPLRLPTRFALAGEKIINIINDGDVETPIRLDITGTATSPKIIKRDTGEFVKVNRVLTSDDTLVITTDFGNKRVELNDINVFNYIDLNSTFFKLDVGDNVIQLITEDENDNASIKITYRNRYLGV